MSILAECSICSRKQSLKNKHCKCGEDLDKAKRSKRVRYWINFRYPGGKQRRELVGYSISEARDADGKRRGQKRENRIFDMQPASKMTFNELTGWYLDLKSVKSLSSYRRIQSALKNFLDEFGHMIVNSIQPVDLENYQNKRESQKKAFATIDMEVSIAKTMVNKAFDNDLVDGHVIKAFRCIKRKLKSGGNARKRVVGISEYLSLITVAPPHLRGIIVTAYNTGMRMGELLMLNWSNVDRDQLFIRLPAASTKESREKDIPMNKHVEKILNGLPRALKHDFVFTHRGNNFHEGGIKKSFKTACINAGVPYGRKTQNGITFHNIRRTVKTNMLYAGVNKVHRDIILGHSLKGMDVHYLAEKVKIFPNSLR